MALLYVASSVICIGYDNTVLTKVTAEAWEHSNLITPNFDRFSPGDQTVLANNNISSTSTCPAQMAVKRSLLNHQYKRHFGALEKAWFTEQKSKVQKLNLTPEVNFGTKLQITQS